MFFRTNIKFLRKRNKFTQDELASALNMKRPTLSGYENGVATPNIEIILQFAKHYHIAIDTLVKIDLRKLSENQLKQLEQGNDAYLTGSKLRVIATTVDSKNNENIELVPERAKAGYKTGYADPEYIKELPVFQLPFLSKERKYRTFQIKGDSMLPIPEKSWVTAEFLTDWRLIENGQAYIIFTIDDGIVFKIVENLSKEGKRRLYSLNPIYEPYEVSLNEVKEIWRFVHYISSQIPEPYLPKESLLQTVEQLSRNLTELKIKTARQ